MCVEQTCPSSRTRYVPNQRHIYVMLTNQLVSHTWHFHNDDLKLCCRNDIIPWPVCHNCQHNSSRSKPYIMCINCVDLIYAHVSARRYRFAHIWLVYHLCLFESVANVTLLHVACKWIQGMSYSELTKYVTWLALQSPYGSELRTNEYVGLCCLQLLLAFDNNPSSLLP